MNLFLEIEGKTYVLLQAKAVSLAIPQTFSENQVNAFGADFATKKTYEIGGFIGNVERGGSCNVTVFEINPHCNGTHTETFQHISAENFPINDVITDYFIPAILITIEPEIAKNCVETYSDSLQAPDKIISANKIQDALLQLDSSIKFDALIIRTLPNEFSKSSQDYSEFIPPYFSQEAIHLINELNIKHLLCDIPSVDRLDDAGKLLNHKLFWSKDKQKTITEFIYVPDSVEDDFYLLNLQIAPFMTDVAPSRPVIFPLHEV